MIVGVDIGLKRIGVAISPDGKITIQPHQSCVKIAIKPQEILIVC